MLSAMNNWLLIKIQLHCKILQTQVGTHIPPTHATQPYSLSLQIFDSYAGSSGHIIPFVIMTKGCSCSVTSQVS